MKLSAYRESLLRLADQVLADYELQVLLQPTSTTSPYFGKDLKAFAEQVFNAVNSPQILTASSMGGTPVPGLTDLDTLPGRNAFAGDKTAPNLVAKPAVPFHAVTHAAPPAGEVQLANGHTTKGMTREQLLQLLKGAMGGGGASAPPHRTPAARG